jgi:hypothetical protein
MLRVPAGAVYYGMVQGCTGSGGASFWIFGLTSTQWIHVSLEASTLETQDLGCLEETNSMTSFACTFLAVSMRVAFEPGDTISASFSRELTIKLWLLRPIVLVTR